MAAKAPGQGSSGAAAAAPEEAWLADLERSKAAVLFKAGKYEEAVAAYSASLRLQPEQPVVWANRAAAQLKLGRPAEAEADCNEAIDRDPGCVAGPQGCGAAAAPAPRLASLPQRP